MIRVNISNSNGIFAYKDYLSQVEADAYIEEMKATEHWGKSEKNILIADELKDEQGNVIAPAQFEYHAAEIFFSTEDVTLKLAQEKINADSLNYLAETDWYVIRKSETGVDIPVEILTNRAAARAAVVRV